MTRTTCHETASDLIRTYFVRLIREVGEERYLNVRVRPELVAKRARVTVSSSRAYLSHNTEIFRSRSDVYHFDPTWRYSELMEMFIHPPLTKDEVTSLREYSRRP